MAPLLHREAIIKYTDHILCSGSPYALGAVLSCLSYLSIVAELATEVRFGPGHTVLNGDPAPPKKGGDIPPNFRPMTVEAKRLDEFICHLVRR